MKNQKLMVNQKKFATKACEAFQATFIRNCGETDKPWKLGLNVPILRLQCSSPMVMTFQGTRNDGHGDPKAPISGH